jgi:hypothetical protein
VNHARLTALYVFLCVWLLWPVAGCAQLPGLLEPTRDALSILCSIRPALVAAHEALKNEDYGEAIRVLRDYVKEHKHDESVKAVLALLEAETKGLGLVEEPSF